MEYLVRYDVFSFSSGVDIYAYLHDRNSRCVKEFRAKVDPPSWIKRKLFKQTMNSLILDTKKSLEREIENYIKSEKERVRIQNEIHKTLYSGKIEGAMLVNGIIQDKSNIGFIPNDPNAKFGG